MTDNDKDSFEEMMQQILSERAKERKAESDNTLDNNESLGGPERFEDLDLGGLGEFGDWASLAALGGLGDLANLGNSDEVSDTLENLGILADTAGSNETNTLDSIGSLFGGLDALKKPAMGILDALQMDGMSGFDPKSFGDVVVHILKELENTIQKSVDENELGVCPQIPPINIFLFKNPYLAYEEVLYKKEGLDAKDKLKDARLQLADYLEKDVK